MQSSRQAVAFVGSGEPVETADALPSSDLFLAGVTGTNGKTTTTVLARHLLRARGPSAAIGTLGLLYLEPAHFEPFNPSGRSPFSAITATAAPERLPLRQ